MPAQVLQSRGGGQRTASGVVLNPLVCLVFATTDASLDVPGTFRDSSVPTSQIAVGELGFQTHVTVAVHGSGESELRSSGLYHKLFSH